MTCKELQQYFENDPVAAIRLAPDSVEIREHIGTCSECDRFVGEQNEIAKYLHSVRDSSLATSPGLDRSVLASYRRYLGERSLVSSVPVSHSLKIREALTWAAAVGFAVMVAYGAMSLLGSGKRGAAVGRNSASSPRQVGQPENNGNQETIATKPIRTKASSVVPSRAHAKKPFRATAEEAKSFPAKFQSLMYCDPISCSGAMDVIRVQVPSAIWGSASTSPHSGVISADVLVGADGIARGIRVIE